MLWIYELEGGGEGSIAFKSSKIYFRESMREEFNLRRGRTSVALLEETRRGK